MELFDAIFTRRSYRGMYKADPVPREDLKKIVLPDEFIVDYVRVWDEVE